MWKQKSFCTTSPLVWHQWFLSESGSRHGNRCSQVQLCLSCKRITFWSIYYLPGSFILRKQQSLCNTKKKKIWIYTLLKASQGSTHNSQPVVCQWLHREMTVHLQLIAFWGVPAVDWVAFTQPGVWGHNGKVFSGNSQYSSEETHHRGQPVHLTRAEKSLMHQETANGSYKLLIRNWNCRFKPSLTKISGS